MADGKVTIDTSLDQKGLDKGIKQGSSKLKLGFEKAGSVAAKATGLAFKGIAVGIGAATTAVGGLVAAGTNAYASYEQLVGGVDTLFKESSQKVQDYAAQAYKTTGQSANKYMENVTGFSASLLQSLGNDTEKAADKANVAMVDMADNANKMGTNMADIQHAYQGFAKQNYTMLDNLKLGYGGTKEEMKRLLEDANKINKQQGINTKYSIESFADIVDAIHVVQNEMGITGTTSKEASSTIEGSVNSMKAAWTNLLVGISDDTQDFDRLTNEFVESAATAASNLIPRIETPLKGIGTLVEKLSPVIAEAVPTVVSDVLPSFVSAGVSMLSGIIEGMQSSQTEIIDGAVQIVDILIDGIGQIAPKLATASLDLILSLGQGFLDNSDKLTNKIPEIINALVTGFDEYAPKFSDLAVNILTTLGQSLLENAGLLIVSFASVVTKAIDSIGESIGDKIPALSFIFDNLDTILVAVTASFVAFKTAMLVTSVIDKATAALKLLSSATKRAELMQAALNLVLSLNPIVLIVTLIAGLTAAVIYLWHTNENFRNFLIGAFNQIKSVLTIVVNAIVQFFTETIPNACAPMITLFTQTIPNAVGEFVDKITEFFTQTIPEVVSKFVMFFTVTIPTAIVSFAESVKTFFTVTIPSYVQSLITWFTELPNKIAYALGYAIGTVIKWGLELYSWITNEFPNIVQGIIDWFSQLPGRIWDALLRAITFVQSWGSQLIENGTTAAKNFFDKVIEYFSALPGRIWNALLSFINYVKSWASQTVSSGATAAKNFFDRVVEWFRQLPGKVGEFLNNVISRLKTWVSEMTKRGKEAASGLFNAVVDGLKSLPSKMETIGSNIVSGIWKGISGGWDWLKKKVSSLAKSLYKGAKDALGIHSPSKKFAWIGEMCAKGMAQGFDANNPLQQIKDIVSNGLTPVRMTMQAQMAGGAGYGTYTQIVNVNQQISTPDQLAQALRIEARYPKF